VEGRGRGGTWEGLVVLHGWYYWKNRDGYNQQKMEDRGRIELESVWVTNGEVSTWNV
jgi:hypothetical protein